MNPWSSIPFFVDAVLRGYGQLFLCNNPVSGVLFLLGLVLVSPENAAWSFMGATLATLGAFLFGMKAESSSGLFGVNGALLGYAWIYYPEVDAPTKALFTLIGGCVILAILISFLHWTTRRKSGVTLFGIPSLLAVGLNTALLTSFGNIDFNLYRGWGALSNNHPTEAKLFFDQVKNVPPRMQAHRSYGLGWAEYRLRNYAHSRRHFLQSDLRDRDSGAGWCSFQLGEFDRAIFEFKTALNCDPRNADAWEGLGWSYAATGQTFRAKECFRRVICLSPLRADAYRGLSWDEYAIQIETNVSRRWQSITLFQWISWLLALLGIAYHSRLSLLVAIAFVTGFSAFGGFADPTLLYNLVPLVLALGGQYLRLSMASMLWLLGTTLVLVLLWPTIGRFSHELGMPILSWPFHLLFIPTLLLFDCLQRRGVVRISVPLGIASTNPSQVSMWFQKTEIARVCWQRLLSGERSDVPGSIRKN